MSRRRKPLAVPAWRSAVAAAAVALAAGLSPIAAHAAPPITVTSQVPFDGPIQYTVKVASKQFGNSQETRTIRSGQTDDFTWKTVPPGGPVAATDQCPNYASLPLDVNGAMIRQTQIRFAPVVAQDGTATVQLSFQAQTPHGTAPVKAGGKQIQCPKSASLSQILRFTMPTNGSVKTLTLSDGSQVSVSAKR
ncbi:hypothetical protein FAZ69_08970 [Trinickia terrae]|uniref:Uncharacterized protein n=1 Tax=Trinickia terrae TaxID=2571161 RepID=A0A4U1IA88_9BURK|nr:DUF6013 family protein [Trinickia terrae]TKC90265.1 hypothetical protein FAZ69_08970 [Trinickia terrae]